MQDFSPLLQFYANKIPDAHGRFISDIWQFDKFKLEFTHNFIQWIFPLKTHSRFHLAPTLSNQDCIDFAHSELLKSNLQKSLDVMLDFWGLKRDGLEITVQKPLTKREYHWLKPYNHNQLRITRAIHCLALCGQMSLAKELQKAVLEVSVEYGNVSERTMIFWQQATEIMAEEAL